MTTSEIDLVRRRLRNQKLVQSALRRPGDVVAWLGAVQAQDYPAARWAVGLRAQNITDADVELAFNEGALLRTHMLRPTWHFVSPADIRWMLALSAPRVHALNAHYYRKLELTSQLFARSRVVLERALRDGRHLTRVELASALRLAGIAAEGPRLAYLMMSAELEALICSGPRRGNQFTYALLEERVQRGMTVHRDEALAGLTRRYFTSRGPATVRDFMWWSGLAARDVRAGIALAESSLVQQVMDGRTYWCAPSKPADRHTAPAAYLLPNYDEFGIAYKDRDVVPYVPRPRGMAARDEFAHLLVIDDQLMGRWRRILKARAVAIEVQPFRSLTKSEGQALEASGLRYGRFMNLPVTLSFV